MDPSVLKGLGRIERLPSFDDRYVLMIDSSNSEAKDDWRKLRSALSGEYDVEPVLLDEEGRLMYPTGKVTVRFVDQLTDDEVERCGQHWGLRGSARNKYISQQVTFHIDQHAAQYLPDLIDMIAQQEGRVQAVWPETISEYKRG